MGRSISAQLARQGSSRDALRPQEDMGRGPDGGPERGQVRRNGPQARQKDLSDRAIRVLEELTALGRQVGVTHVFAISCNIFNIAAVDGVLQHAIMALLSHCAQSINNTCSKVTSTKGWQIFLSTTAQFPYFLFLRAEFGVDQSAYDTRAKCWSQRRTRRQRCSSAPPAAAQRAAFPLYRQKAPQHLDRTRSG